MKVSTQLGTFPPVMNITTRLEDFYPAGSFSTLLGIYTTSMNTNEIGIEIVEKPSKVLIGSQVHFKMGQYFLLSCRVEKTRTIFNVADENHGVDRHPYC